MGSQVPTTSTTYPVREIQFRKACTAMKISRSILGTVDLNMEKLVAFVDIKSLRGS